MDAYRHYLLAEKCAEAYHARGCQVWSHHETDVLFEYHDDHCILAVRGTEFEAAWPLEWSLEGLSNTRDIIRDLRFIPWQDPISLQWMHKGFGVSAYRWLRRFRARLPIEGVQYLLTGHSLGAGIASHLARMMLLAGYDVREVVVFGEPRGHYWGSRGHYNTLGISTVSYRNRNDWIRFAGLGRTAVTPVLLDAGDRGMMDSHNMTLYVETLRGIANRPHQV